MSSPTSQPAVPPLRPAVLPLPAVGSRDTTTTPPDQQRWLVLALVATAALMVVLDSTIVNIALPSARQKLDFPGVDPQWVITAYALAVGSLLLIGGKLRALLPQDRRLRYEHQ